MPAHSRADLFPPDRLSGLPNVADDLIGTNVERSNLREATLVERSGHATDIEVELACDRRGTFLVGALANE